MSSTGRCPPRAMLEPLALAFAFDAAEQDGVLRSAARRRAGRRNRRGRSRAAGRTAPGAADARAGNRTAARSVDRLHRCRHRLPARRAASRRLVGGSTRSAHADLAVVTNDGEAERRADIWLQDLWAGRESAEFALPPSRLALGPGDVVGLTVNGRRRLIEMRAITDTEQPRDAGRVRSIRTCSMCRWRRRAGARLTSPAAGRPGAGAGARSADADADAAAGPVAARGVRRSLAGAGRGLALVRRR